MSPRMDHLEYKYVIEIPLIRAHRVDWNEICVWVLEQFGLPGDRYSTHATTDSMTFRFKNRQDLIWMKLRWA